MESKKPIIGVTMGDPAGIGPEVILKSIEHLSNELINLVIIGSKEVMDRAIRSTNLKYKLKVIETIEDINLNENINNLPYLIDLNNIELNQFNYGETSKEAGRASIEYIFKAIELAKEGKIDAIVTAPISKESINMAGFNYSGHTEILAEKTNTRDYAMMLSSDGLRVIHVSTHVSLREACNRVKKDRVYNVIKLAQVSMKRLGYDNPKIGVAGLNPHAGEGGLFGYEEIEEIIPAIKKAQLEEITVEGPIPPDTIFAKGIGGFYDIIVVMYHDQGHIPIKTIGFSYNKNSMEVLSVKGVNITLGLPVIRTSVDHGVAFDIAGKGIANEDSMVDAIIKARKFIENTSLHSNS